MKLGETKKFDAIPDVAGRGQKRSPVRNRIDALNVGEGFEIDKENAGTIRGIAWYAGKTAGRKYVSRTINGKLFIIRTE